MERYQLQQLHLVEDQLSQMTILSPENCPFSSVARLTGEQSRPGHLCPHLGKLQTPMRPQMAVPDSESTCHRLQQHHQGDPYTFVRARHPLALRRDRRPLPRATVVGASWMPLATAEPTVGTLHLYIGRVEHRKAPRPSLLTLELAAQAPASGVAVAAAL